MQRRLIYNVFFKYIRREACTSVPISQEQSSSTVLTISRFISSCNPEQIRLAPEKCKSLWKLIVIFICVTTAIWIFDYLLSLSADCAVVSVCKRFKDQVLLLEAPIRGVAPLLTAIRKLQTSSEHLTTLHPEFLLLCLLAKCYKTGRSILDNDILEVDQPRDLFLYCYYGWVAFLLHDELSVDVFFLLWLRCILLSSCSSSTLLLPPMLLLPSMLISFDCHHWELLWCI